jgi:hypothetical protein
VQVFESTVLETAGPAPDVAPVLAAAATLSTTPTLEPIAWTPEPTSTPTPKPTLTEAPIQTRRWQQTLSTLDTVWGSDWPRTIDILEKFLVEYPGDAEAMRRPSTNSMQPSYLLAVISWHATSLHRLPRCSSEPAR